MTNSMRGCLYIFIFVLSVEGLEDSQDQYLRDENNALTALKQAFDHPPFAGNWSGVQCSGNISSWFGLQCLNNRVVSISLTDLGLSGMIRDPLILANLTELTLLSLKNNSISGTMMNFSYNQKLITSIDLSLNLFTGPISSSLTSLNLLQSLHLNKNRFNGSIPPLNQTSLTSFDVSFNSLSGEIPDTVTLRSFGPKAYVGNPDLCGEPTYKTCVVSRKKHNKIKDFLLKPSLISIFIILDFILLVFQIYSLYLFCKKSNKKGHGKINAKAAAPSGHNIDIEQDKEEMVITTEDQMKVTFFNGEGGSFLLKDLLKSPAEALGKGSFGSCYKATKETGQPIVVKRLRNLSPLSLEEFSKHMQKLAVFHHPNLHSLLGYHFSSEEKLLISNFATNGNLFDRLHGGRGINRTPFQWNSRLSVAKDVAKAMAYLHKMSGGMIIPHGNLKASNVLLDENDTALVTDYCLTPIVPPSLAASFMLAYKSPEYVRRRKVSRKSDVWSYGCLLVELITGKLPDYSSPEGGKGVDLGNWIHKAVREEWTFEVFDLELAAQRDAYKGMFMLLQVALRCCEKSPEKRPEMEEVVEEVEAIKPCASDEDEDEQESSGSTSN
ncbi:hypothetical protein J5N97_017058 [Dioscorea zingiberensis]|uniref:Protein kinase domain-containing protein n=1 Tax=Dioscorea zingiberensis TaxID=325984 RepID=A0A9D5HG81_9LILI|nr:hypothetical protein J5N97_017058 [Dioscorea zingiberensis]